MTDCKNCTNCANAIFDEVWGEYKCTVLKHRIYDLNMYTSCTAHKPVKEEKKNDQN